MAFTVRIFGYRGMVQTPIVLPRQDSKDSVFLLTQPYEFALNASTNGLTPVVLGNSIPPDFSTILRVEVPDGQAIRYEVNAGGRTVDASPNSPILFGLQHLAWGAQWILSIIDAAGT